MSNDKEQNLRDGLEQQEKKQKENKQNITNKRQLQEEENEVPPNPKRHCGYGEASCSDSGSTSSPSSDDSSSSEDSSSGNSSSEDSSSRDSFLLNKSMSKSNGSREAEFLKRQDSHGGANPSYAELFGCSLSGADPAGASISGANPRTRAKPKIEYSEATSTTSSPEFNRRPSEEKEYAAEFEDE